MLKGEVLIEELEGGGGGENGGMLGERKTIWLKALFPKFAKEGESANPKKGHEFIENKGYVRLVKFPSLDGGCVWGGPAAGGKKKLVQGAAEKIREGSGILKSVRTIQ